MQNIMKNFNGFTGERKKNIEKSLKKLTFRTYNLFYTADVFTLSPPHTHQLIDTLGRSDS